MADDQTPVVPTETPVEPQTPVAENPTPQDTPVPEIVSPVLDSSNPSTPPNPSDIPDSPDLLRPEENSQPVPPEQAPPTEQQNIPETKQQTEIPTLSFPFYGVVSSSLSFNQIPDDERIRQKFKEWGIVGHNGLDFPLAEGTEVLACDSGKIIQAGHNGDYGISVTIQHSWGQSIYAHLKETKISTDQDIKAGELIGLSDQTGAAFGPHLHFAISPSNSDPNNGYLGFIDPASYLQTLTQKPEQPKPPEEPKPAEQPSQPETPPVQPESTQAPESTPEPSINIESVNLPTEEKLQQPVSPQIPEPSQIPQNPQVPQVDEIEVQKQVDEKLAVELEARRLKANEVRKDKRQEHLQEIEKLLQEKNEITNQDVRDLTHVSQTTATEYLSTLVKSGSIKMEGKGKATVYKNIFS